MLDGIMNIYEYVSCAEMFVKTFQKDHSIVFFIMLQEKVEAAAFSGWPRYQCGQ